MSCTTHGIRFFESFTRALIFGRRIYRGYNETYNPIKENPMLFNIFVVLAILAVIRPAFKTVIAVVKSVVEYRAKRVEINRLAALYDIRMANKK